MVIKLPSGKLKTFISNRWFVFVAAMWVQSGAGVGYLFGSLSPVIKSAMGYNQRQVAMLGVAKDLGDSIGFIAGSLSEILPIWGILLIGVFQNLIGYGLVWLIVTSRVPSMPLWVLCLCIFIGTNGETYYNTASLVSCVQNFPKSRGPIVGILKGFAGLSGAIITQIYLMINAPSSSSLIFMVAVGPSMVVLSLMFIVRPVGGHKQLRSSDNSSFLFVYSICLILAAYLMGVLLVEDIIGLGQTLITVFTIILLILILLPIVIPISIVMFTIPKSSSLEDIMLAQNPPDHDPNEHILLSELEEEKTGDMDSLSAIERQKRMTQIQKKLFQAAAVGAVRRRPHRGEDFTLLQALGKADFLLMFVSLVLASGSGLTIIDNMGQICESLGHSSSSVFVSMISIWNFLGRVGGGYFSEVVVRKYAYPRPVAMAVAQIIMAMGLFYYAMGWPGAIYVITVLIGLCYGAHWAIVPAAASELFGLKSFGALYNFLTLASTTGSLFFSGVIASGIYDYEAKKQASVKSLAGGTTTTTTYSCTGVICYSITCAIMTGFCLIAVGLSMIVVYRTKSVYAQLYRKTLS